MLGVLGFRGRRWGVGVRGMPALKQALVDAVGHIPAFTCRVPAGAEGFGFIFLGEGNGQVETRCHGSGRGGRLDAEEFLVECAISSGLCAAYWQGDMVNRHHADPADLMIIIDQQRPVSRRKS